MKKLLILSFFGLCTVLSFAQVYNLPNLPFSYDAYEPYVDAQTMEIHHGKHHAAYVNNLNKAIAGTTMENTSMNNLLMYASFRSAAVRNNAGGHYNHSLFWDILAPKAAQSLFQLPCKQRLSISTKALILCKSSSIMRLQRVLVVVGPGWSLHQKVNSLFTALPTKTIR